MTAAPPRVRPGRRADIGLVNTVITGVAGRVVGGRAPNIFTTLARHRRLFRAWMRFAGRLMPGGTLPRQDTELVILRVSDNCRCAYERDHHERIGRRVGLSDEEIARVAEGPDAPGWTPRQVALLRAVDELHAERTLSDPAWAALRAELPDDRQAIELCLLVGHYEMLAMTINALRVPLDR
ncbi:MAG: 4-carboxymuconolactone decarboxylase [Solirubrobacterales bacterium]|nr:4-carboxymuconolactone decarboxylase [Solirubrobacterales bacterium]